MGIVEEFNNYYENTFSQHLPDELEAKYLFVKCLKSTVDVDTLLMKDKASGEKAVVKCYKKESRFYDAQEAESLKNIKSDVIPQLIGIYKNEWCRCVCKNYIEGVPLDEYVKNTHITQAILKDVATELAKTMKILHDLEPPIIHRDIKPSNIIVKEDGSVALIDLGVSRIYKENESSDTTFWGTEEYAPPEQFGFMQTDVRSDIYSFGIVLTWLLTGKPDPIKNPLTKLEKVAAKCCKFSPDKRYQNDDALLGALYRTTDAYTLHRKKLIKRTFMVIAALTAVLLSRSVVYRSSLPNNEVSFREPLIEEAVRVMLDCPDGRITYEDLEKVTEIYIQGNEVYTSEDEFYDEGGKWYGPASDRIKGSITDISDLENMPNLHSVFIGGNNIDDISPLKDLKYLQKLEFRDNDIEDLSPLTGMNMLTVVDMLGNPLKSIDTVRTLPAIRCLYLDETGNYDGSPVANLKSMEELSIRNDSDAYQYLDSLYVHILAIGTPLQTDLECIRNVTYVEHLIINRSDIRDISALEGREDIVYLEMEGCFIDDLSPLFTMPNLAKVTLSAKGQEQMEELISIYGEPRFEIIYT